MEVQKNNNAAEAVLRTRLLVVEDEAIVRMDIEGRLKRMGYEVVGSVADGESAIRLAEAKEPDMVLMDIRLHGKISGIMASQTIRNRLQIPIVYVTAYADEDTFSQAKATHPFAYVIKPFTDRELLTAIEIALIHSRQEKTLEQKNRELLALNKQFYQHLEERFVLAESYKRLHRQLQQVSDLIKMAYADVGDPIVEKRFQRIHDLLDKSLAEADAQILPEINPLIKVDMGQGVHLDGLDPNPAHRTLESGQ